MKNTNSLLTKTKQTNTEIYVALLFLAAFSYAFRLLP